MLSQSGSCVQLRGVFEPDNLLRTGIASARGPPVHGALSYRAQSPGPGKPSSTARIRHCPTPSPCSTPTAPRRNAQPLPSGRSLTKVDSFFGQLAIEAQQFLRKNRHTKKRRFEKNAKKYGGERGTRTLDLGIMSATL